LTGMPPATGPGVITIADSSLWAWLRFDDDGIMVRNLFRTYRIGWEEVRWFTDGASALPGGGVYYWALDIVLRDGRVITATGTSSQTWTARPGTLTAIRQAAERHGVPAVFTARNRRSTRRCPRGFTTIRAASRGCGTGPAPSGRRTCTLTRPAASQQEKTAQPRCGHLFLSQTSSGTGTISLPGPGGRGSGWPSAWS
jgi:hypothetical protein